MTTARSSDGTAIAATAAPHGTLRILAAQGHAVADTALADALAEVRR